jgi:hypothetical protein
MPSLDKQSIVSFYKISLHVILSITLSPPSPHQYRVKIRLMLFIIFYGMIVHIDTMDKYMIVNVNMKGNMV